jgi:hypothetical protein
LKSYLDGAIGQQISRGEGLIKRIPQNISREFHLLAQSCQERMLRVNDSLGKLLTDSRFQNEKNQPERLRIFRRLVDEMFFLETVGIAALERANPSDEILNKIVEKIRLEIRYPLLPPVVTSLSQEYFHIFPDLNLLCVPLAESDHLLHLPDIYHELAHPLATGKPDPRIKPFQQAIENAIRVELEYVSNQYKKEKPRRGPEEFKNSWLVWEKNWVRWSVEFFCDLFGVYTLGPAYVWAHINLYAKYGGDPFDVPRFVPNSHPADDARFRAMIAALKNMGFAEQVISVSNEWSKLLKLSNASSIPEYWKCYPDHVIDAIANQAKNGVIALGCRIAAPSTNDYVHCLLNRAWDKFWENPKEYNDWENKRVNELRVYLKSN